MFDSVQNSIQLLRHFCICGNFHLHVKILYSSKLIKELEIAYSLSPKNVLSPKLWVKKTESNIILAVLR